MLEIFLNLSDLEKLEIDFKPITKIFFENVRNSKKIILAELQFLKKKKKIGANFLSIEKSQLKIFTKKSQLKNFTSKTQNPFLNP